MTTPKEQRVAQKPVLYVAIFVLLHSVFATLHGSVAFSSDMVGRLHELLDGDEVVLGMFLFFFECVYSGAVLEFLSDRAGMADRYLFFIVTSWFSIVWVVFASWGFGFYLEVIAGPVGFVVVRYVNRRSVSSPPTNDTDHELQTIYDTIANNEADDE
ncbi:hypothetical protein PG994_004858 [Apiospora phragmitis]|uniref:Uncharacterized protein n=1 Tax=Apiospora phragmitis TaxID=2905665 RepID=A0ABR1VRS6_9PEZI